jgi:hypothetical protein
MTMITIPCLAQSIDSSSETDKSYESEKYGYRVDIPAWLNVKETGNSNSWGGTMEPLNGVQNAILVVGYTKREYKKLKKLIYDKVGQYKLGDKINENQTFLLRKELGIIEEKGVGYKVQLLTGKKQYDSAFVFVQTKKGFIWIIFTATPDTYKTNFEKFKSFLSGLEVV